MTVLSETEDTVTISKSTYESLLEDSDWLACLEAAGVDNWGGIEVAIEMRNEELDESNS